MTTIPNNNVSLSNLCVQMGVATTSPFSLSKLYDATNVVGATIPARGNPLSQGIFRGVTRYYDFPPAAMTANTTTFSGLQYGNGTYTVSTASLYPGSQFYFGFDSNNTTYLDTAYPLYDSTTGNYAGSVSTSLQGGGSVSGEYIQINLPVPIVVTAIKVFPRNTYSKRLPGNFTMCASSDGITWKQVATYTNAVYTEGTWNTVYITNSDTNGYKYWRCVVTRNSVGSTTGNYGNITLFEMRFVGYQTP